MPFVRVRRGFALLVLAVVAAGCSGGGSAPRVLPTVSTVSSASPTGSPVPVVQAKTRAGLIAFVRSYYTAINEASRTQDTTRLASLSDPRCSCFALVRYFRRVFSRGGSIRGFTYTITRSYDARVREGAGTLTVLYNIPAAKELDRRGQVVHREAPVHAGTDIVTTFWRDGHWVVTGISTVG